MRRREPSGFSQRVLKPPDTAGTDQLAKEGSKTDPDTHPATTDGRAQTGTTKGRDFPSLILLGMGEASLESIVCVEHYRELIF